MDPNQRLFLETAYQAIDDAAMAGNKSGEREQQYSLLSRTKASTGELLTIRHLIYIRLQ